jgi:hypothetical protein
MESDGSTEGATIAGQFKWLISTKQKLTDQRNEPHGTQQNYRH